MDTQQDQQLKKNQLKFPVSKVKKIVQENQDVGKINNVVPYVLTKSLELFLSDILSKCKETLKDRKLNKATPGLLKIVLQESQYDFMKDYAQKLPDLEESKKKKKGFQQDEQSDELCKKRKGNDEFEKVEKKAGGRKSKRVRRQQSDDDYDEDD
ncbi:unnamed protein product [Paramecium octaurelia]|uniref:Transcription factor CBF/NF-Y/archaeal histone domain-containing protein n=1 Tax=Paramecium octaurelia TaxID=43137 RepID=A0A8S1XRD9_PAROT|nr:unnamed protein product [Paramecium octaurelia]